MHNTPVTYTTTSIRAKAQPVQTLAHAYDTPIRVRPTTQTSVATRPPA